MHHPAPVSSSPTAEPTAVPTAVPVDTTTLEPTATPSTGDCSTFELLNLLLTIVLLIIQYLRLRAPLRNPHLCPL